MKMSSGLDRVGGFRRGLWLRIAGGLVVAALGTASSTAAQNYQESIVYSFAGGNDGVLPYAPLLQASDGNLYGTTYYAGSGGCASGGCGTVFKISDPTTSPTESVIYSFIGVGGSDGAEPYGGLIQASDGNLYGTTASGGLGDLGTVFKISNPSISPTESVIYSFRGVGVSDGANPLGGLIQASDGNLYGTTSVGGSGGHGTVFKISNLTTVPTESVIYSFAGGSDGVVPYAPLIQASDGNLYGTTIQGGPSVFGGTVFKISNLAGTPTESVVYNFTGGSDGANPYGGLIQASDGNLYGTTTALGSGGGGTVFRISNLAGTPNESPIYSFTGGSDGANPYGAALIQASDGNLYGTTLYGGLTGCVNGCGTVFKISNFAGTATESVIYSFTAGSNGSRAALIQASDGNLYGTTVGGGSTGNGTVFMIAGLPMAGLLGYFTVTPCRLIDTRPGSIASYGGPAMAGGSLRGFVAPGFCGVPSGAKAVSANLTAVAPQARGDLRVFPSLNQRSPASNLNFNLGNTRAGNGIFSIDTAGSFTIQCDMAAGTSTNVLFDVNGYFK